MMKLPVARNTEIVMQNAGKELLIYDLKTNKAYNLNETSALIFNHCDGKTTFNDLKLKHRHLTDDFIYFALDELKRENLIMTEYRSAFAGTSRREVIKKIGLATIIAMPVITSIIAPPAAHAQSCLACYSARTVPHQCLPPIDPNEVPTCIPYCGSICCGAPVGVDVSIEAGGCQCNNVICA